MTNDPDNNPINLGLYRILKKKNKNFLWFKRKHQELKDLQESSIPVQDLKKALEKFPSDARISFVHQGENPTFFRIKNLAKGPKNIILAFLKSDR